MRVSAFASTDIGRKRSNNEDSLLIDPQLRLYAVSDGMGGHEGGEVASKTAVRALQQYMAKHAAALASAEDELNQARRAAARLAEAVAYANETVRKLAQTDSKLSNMGATLTALYLVGEQMAVMAHVGDSRLYLCRNDEVHQLSTDHTVGQQLVEFGLIAPEEQGANRHKLLRAVGHESRLSADTLILEVSVGDTFLLCSDGLSNYFDDDDGPRELVPWLNRGDLQRIPVGLVALANERGGEDNITALCVRAELEGEPGSVHAQRSSLLNLAQACLRQVPLFTALPWRDFARVYGLTGVVKLDPGMPFELGSEPQQPALAVVFRGTVAADGVVYPEGTVFGCLRLLGFSEMPQSLIAEQPTQLIVLYREPFDGLAERHPEIVIALQRHLIADLHARALGPDGRYIAHTVSE